MHTDTFCRHLAAVLATAAAEHRLEALAGELAGFFKVQSHEIGLFKLDKTGRSALFVWPPHRLAQEVRIPIKSFAASLVSATARTCRGSINNTFAATSHLHMFEHALVEREHCIPMQKVMTAPGADGEQLRWIVQISRKGRTLAEAGPDFTDEQLQELEVITRFIATLPW